MAPFVGQMSKQTAVHNSRTAAVHRVSVTYNEKLLMVIARKFSLVCASSSVFVQTPHSTDVHTKLNHNLTLSMVCLSRLLGIFVSSSLVQMA